MGRAGQRLDLVPCSEHPHTWAGADREQVCPCCDSAEPHTCPTRAVARKQRPTVQSKWLRGGEGRTCQVRRGARMGARGRGHCGSLLPNHRTWEWRQQAWSEVNSSPQGAIGTTGEGAMLGSALAWLLVVLLACCVTCDKSCCL